MEMDGRVPEPYFIQRLRKLFQEAFTLRMAGFMLAKAWVLAFFFIPSGFFGWAPMGSLLSFDALSRNALIVTLLVFGIKAASWVRPQSVKACCLLAAIFSVVGTFFAAAPFNEGVIGLVSLAMAALLTGMGSGMLSVMWGIEFSRTTSSVTAAEVSVAYACATFILPAYVLLPQWGQVLVLVVLPIVSAILLYYQMRFDEERPSEQPDEVVVVKSPRQSRVELAKIAISSMVFAAVIILLRGVYEAMMPLFPSSSAALAASSALAGSFIVIAVLLFSKKPETSFSYKPVMLLIAGGCFLLPMIEAGTTLPYFFARVGYICFLVLNIVLLSNLASRGSLKPGVVFGVGLAALSVGMFLGQLCVVLAENAGGLLQGNISALSGLLVFILLVTYVLTMTNHVASSSEPHPFAAGKEMPDQGLSSIPSEAAFDQRCRSLAERSGISERACEVMILYAKGRSKSRIEQELYISQSTVSFHLRNIYQKLGIHSRQELIDAIEAASLDGE